MTRSAPVRRGARRAGIAGRRPGFPFRDFDPFNPDGRLRALSLERNPKTLR